MKKVLKFGGSSVAGTDQMRRVVDIVANQPKPCVVVVSALGGVTDMLKSLARAAMAGHHEELLGQLLDRHIALIDELLSGESRTKATDYTKARVDELDVICQGIHMLQELSQRSEARLMSFGELISSYIITEAIQSKVGNAIRLDARELIQTDDQLMRAEVNMKVTVEKIKAACVNVTGVAIIPGFISSTESGVTSTLGRGGSDYTAAIFAHALNVEVLEIWSDVSGMLTANPKIVNQAQSITKMSYNEAFELSHFGAKVLYPPAIQPAYESDIPVLLKNTFDPADPGTLIDQHVESKEHIVTGISSIDEVAMVNLTGIGMVGVSGYSSRVFKALHEADVNVVMIAQSCSERGICVAVDHDDLHQTHEALNMTFQSEIASGRIDPIKLEEKLSIVALVGDGMKYRSGVSGRIFSVLGHYGINIRAIAQGSSESNISIIIDSADEYRAIRVLHESFFEHKPTPIHLFIAGVGTVGSSFIELIMKHNADILKNHNYKINICGVANSRKMIHNNDGLSPDTVLAELNASEHASNLNELVAHMISLKVPNKVFVDNTATPDTAPLYKHCMESGIHVVTCNKIVASDDLQNYRHLKQISNTGHAHFHYETNVGAALPVIHTISDMVRTGDHIDRIEAVLSGSLNYVYDAYDGSESFETVVREAQAQGYTEPNPMMDLSGADVIRKIVILAREAGYAVSIDDVICKPDMPQSCLAAESTEQVFEALASQEDYFRNRVEKARSSGNKLKYIAELRNNKLTVGLQEINSDHIFYSLKGTDNMIAIYSTRYADNPLVIQGAGAGPENTASGVLSDVLRIEYDR